MESAPTNRRKDEKQQHAAQTTRQAYQHAYHQQHRHALNAKRRERYRRNPAPMLQAHRIWVAKNRERRKAAQTAWYHKHRERELAKRRAYYAAHREEERAKDRAAYKRKRDAALRALLDEL
jgi:hypothetical protein